LWSEDRQIVFNTLQTALTINVKYKKRSKQTCKKCPN
jgi:hypothetical protein